MSLDFNVGDIADHANVTTAPHPNSWTGKEQWHPVTNSLVWATIPCGTPSITAENVDMVWKRISRWQEVIGAFCNGPKGDVYVRREDVVMHIGLRTNASEKTEAEFIDSLLRQMDRHVQERKQKNAMDIIGWKGRPGTGMD